MSAHRGEHGRRAMLFFFLMLAAGPPVTAAVPAGEVRAELGIGGWIALGRVVPLVIDVRAAAAFSGVLRVEVPAERRGGAPVTHVVRLRLPAGGRHQTNLDVIVHDPRRPLVITMRDARGERFRQEVPVSARHVAEGVVAALTREAAGLEFLAGADEKRRAAYVSEADLPVRWQAYDTVDLLIIRDLDPRTVSPAQEQALAEWIAQGGRLLVVAPQRLHLSEAGWLRGLLPASGQRLHGLGVVAVAPEDLFAPAARARGELRARVRALVDRPSAPGLDAPALADVLPATRPLSGTTQFGLAALSLLYVLGVRGFLRRLRTWRAGWIALTVLVAGATAGLYGIASGARTAAGALAQLSVAEVLGDLPVARVSTYAAVLAPYGGAFAVRVPDGVVVRPLDDAGVVYDGAVREIRGTAADGQVMLVARQIVPLRLRVRRDASGTLSVESAGPALQGAVLYRKRQLYRLPAGPNRTVRIDPTRWEPADRPGVLGQDVVGRAMAVLLRRLDRADEATWFVAQMDDDRLGLRTERGAKESVRLVIAEVR